MLGGCCGLVAVVWSLWFGRYAVVWSLRFGRSGLFAVVWSLWFDHFGLVAVVLLYWSVAVGWPLCSVSWLSVGHFVRLEKFLQAKN